MNEHGYTEPMKTVSVLIDTWWNVNVEDTINGCNDLIVLIDTWWNVNYLYFCIFQIAFPVLIDTWWNVNFSILLSALLLIPF
ncbi:hypothetical protein CLOL250_00480 [Clostridium sp. L2-50]|nr:hypothetical protein CLOL250_00480 [Clostridium sp. L2-50]